MDEDEGDEQAFLEALQTQMMDALKSPNAKESLQDLIERTSKVDGFQFDIHFRDYHGYSLLGRAVKGRLMKVIKYLIEEKSFKVKEELVIAVEVDYKECVDYLITWKPELLDRKILAGTVCRPGMMPVMKAALMENESMLRFLFARGAKPLELPKFNPGELHNIIRFDSIYRTLVAVSKPMYLCVMNEDPVMMAFKIAETCEKMAAQLDVAKDDLLMIKEKCDKFAADFVKQASTFDDLELFMKQMTMVDINVVAPGEYMERLNYALVNNHQALVANGSVQKLVKRKFYSGPIALNDFEGANLIQKMIYVAALVLLSPLWILLYLIFPASDSPSGKFVKSWMEMPFMRFIVNFTIYVVVCILIVSTSFHTAIFPMDRWPVLAAGRNCLSELTSLNQQECILFNVDYSEEQKEQFINNPLLYRAFLLQSGQDLYEETFSNSTSEYIADAVVSVWILGNVYREFLTIWSASFEDYCSDWINVLNILLNICLLSAAVLKNSFVAVNGYSPRELNSVETYHPLEVSSALRSLGLLLLFYRLYKLLRVTQIVGKQQILLVEAFKASMAFLLIFIAIAVSFSVASNGVLWRTYRDYIQSCVLLPNGSYQFSEHINIPCPTNMVKSSVQELIDYQDFIRVFVTYFFGMFNAHAYIIEIFPSYENPQEWTAMLLYTSYVFVGVIVRLNMITSLVIFAVMSASRRELIMFKFERTKLMSQFIGHGNFMPPPFNLIPSVYRITAWIRERQMMKHKMFAEEELQSVPRLRKLILSAKLGYLREMKLSGVRNQASIDEMETLSSGFKARVQTVNTAVLSIHRRSRQYIENSSDKTGAAQEENQFTAKFQKLRGPKIQLPDSSDLLKLKSFFKL